MSLWHQRVMVRCYKLREWLRTMNEFVTSEEMLQVERVTENDEWVCDIREWWWESWESDWERWMSLWYQRVTVRCYKFREWLKTMSEFDYFRRRMIWKTAWERDEWLLAKVTPDVRTELPCCISFITSSVLLISASFKPMICTCCLPSSNTRSFCLLFNKSNTYNSNQPVSASMTSQWRHSSRQVKHLQQQPASLSLDHDVTMTSLITSPLSQLSYKTAKHNFIFCVIQFVLCGPKYDLKFL